MHTALIFQAIVAALLLTSGYACMDLRTEPTGKLVPGQEISLKFGGIPDPAILPKSSTYVIGGNGLLSFPTVNVEVQAAGKVTSQLTSSIVDAFCSQDKFRGITVELSIPENKTSESDAVLIKGYVKSCPHKLTHDDLDLQTALVEAGGITETGDPRTVKLIRDKLEFFLNLSEEKCAKVFLRRGDCA